MTNETRTNHSVSRQVNYLILPFAYRTSYKCALDRLDSKKELWAKKDISKQQLFQHINRLVDESEGYNETIGKRYILTDNGGRSFFGLPAKPGQRLNYTTESKENVIFKFEQVQVYLFETQVGFLVYRVSYPDYLAADEIINANYYMKKFTRSKYKVTYEKKISREVAQTVEIDMCDLTHDLLEDFDVITYFENETRLPHQAQVYSAVILNEDINKDELHELLFRMRRSFKDSYRPSSAEFDTRNNAEILHSFENSYWGISLEGLANIVYHVENEGTNNFFQSTYYGYLHNTYFYIYLLALHQRYALLYMSTMAAQIPNSIDAYIKGRTCPENSKYTITHIREIMVYFTLRCSFKQLSNVTHKEKLYEAIRERLGIEGLMDELHSELISLDSMAELVETKEKARQLEEEQVRREGKEEKKKRFETMVLVMTTFFVIISTLEDGTSFIQNLFKSESWPPDGSLQYILTILLWVLVPCAGIILPVYYWFSLRRDERK